MGLDAMQYIFYYPCVKAFKTCLSLGLSTLLAATLSSQTFAAWTPPLRRDLLSEQQISRALPTKLASIATENAYIYNPFSSNRAVTANSIFLQIEVPAFDFQSVTPRPGLERKVQAPLVNINAKKFSELPLKRFIFGDGTLQRVFVDVDSRPGSVLSLMMDSIVKDLERNLFAGQPIAIATRDPRNREKLLKFLAEHVNDVLAWPAEGEVLPWDKHVAVPGPIRDSVLKLHNQLLLPQYIEDFLSVGGGYQHPVIPFEYYLRVGKGYCIQMVILADLILNRAEIPHNVVAGATVIDENNGSGHSWIDLEDGRILDVAWKTLAQPKRNTNKFHSDWDWFGNAKGSQFRYRYKTFSVLDYSER